MRKRKACGEEVKVQGKAGQGELKGKRKAQVLLGDELKGKLHGRRYCSVDELTREFLLSYLEEKGVITFVQSLLSVDVQTLAGASFCVTLDDQHNLVSSLKAEIQNIEGIPAFQQQLFLVGGSENTSTPLNDNDRITNSCSVSLCVQPSLGMHEYIFERMCGLVVFILVLFELQNGSGSESLTFCILTKQGTLWYTACRKYFVLDFVCLFLVDLKNRNACISG